MPRVRNTLALFRYMFLAAFLSYGILFLEI